MERAQKLHPAAEGSLGQTPLAHLFVFVDDRKLTGSLLLDHGENDTSVIVFYQGSPAKARTTLTTSRLGTVVFQLGMIDRATLDNTVEQARASNALFGHVLLKNGAIEQAQLLEALREQTLRRLLKIFEHSSPSTTFSFYEQVNLLDSWGGPELTPIDGWVAVWEGILQCPCDPSIDATLARLGDAPLGFSNSANLTRFRFRPGENKVVHQLVASPTSLSQLLQTNALPNRNLRLLIYTLVITKNLVPLLPGQQALPKPATVTSDHQQMPTRSGPSYPDATSATSTPEPTPPPAPNSIIRTPQGFRAPATSSPRITQPVRQSSQPLVPRVTHPSISSGALPSRASQTSIMERSSITQFHDSMGQQNYFELLQVTPSSTADEIQSSYLSLAKRWHPDRLPSDLRDLQPQCSAIFSRISLAYDTLTNPERRLAYEQALERDEAPTDEQQEVRAILDATIDFQKAQVLMRKRNWTEALVHGQRAYHHDPQSADHAALYAWLLIQPENNPEPDDISLAKQLLNQAIELNDHCELAYYYRAMMHKQHGNHREALRDFRNTVKLNPYNIEASRELRLAQIRGLDDEASNVSSSRASDANQKPSDARPRSSVVSFFGKLFSK